MLHITVNISGFFISTEFFTVEISHQNKHHYGQDVENSIAEQRPPAQTNGLQRERKYETQ